MNKGCAKWRCGRLIGRVSEKLKTRKQGGVLVVGLADVDNLSQGLVRILPLRVLWRRRWDGGARASHGAEDGDIEVVARIGRLEPSGQVERDELQLNRIRVDDALVEAVLKSDEGR